MSSLREFIGRLPKAELHVHLEGSMRPPVLLRLAREHGVELPARDEAGLRRWFEFRDFDHFVEIYVTCSSCLRDPEDFQLLTRDVLAEMERQNVLYAEAHFTISTHMANGVNSEEVADALYEVICESEKSQGPILRLIPDIVRNVDRERADWTLEWALENRHRGVVALGLSGIESYPDAPFSEHFTVATGEGLHRVAHAGEHGGPDSIRSALLVTNPERIGHGVRAIESPELTAELAARKIPLEVCPTSNVRLGVTSSLADHPLPHLVAAGCCVSLDVDDPALMGTNLNGEYEAVSTTFGWGAAELAQFAQHSFDAAFLESDLRQQLQERFQSAVNLLNPDYS